MKIWANKERGNPIWRGERGGDTRENHLPSWLIATNYSTCQQHSQPVDNNIVIEQLTYFSLYNFPAHILPTPWHKQIHTQTHINAYAHAYVHAYAHASFSVPSRQPSCAFFAGEPHEPPLPRRWTINNLKNINNPLPRIHFVHVPQTRYTIRISVIELFLDITAATAL